MTETVKGHDGAVPDDASSGGAMPLGADGAMHLGADGAMHLGADGAMHFRAGDATAMVAPAAGGRLASLTIGDLDLLVGHEPGAPMAWGSYPMVPFAGRIRHGRFVFEGVEHRLPVNLGVHAIHGYGYTGRWAVVADDTIAWDLAAPWPWPGRVTQCFELEPDRLRVTMTVEAHETQPVMIGWHPWFRRDIGAAATATLSVDGGRMYRRDDEGIPTGELVDPPAGPWDDCFSGFAADPVLRWGDELEVVIGSTCDHWVIYDEPEHALCVEPQSGAPDEVNRQPTVVSAGETLRHTMTLRWRRPATA